MVNKRFTKLGTWALVFALACSTPILPEGPTHKKKTEKKDEDVWGYWKSFKKSVNKMYRRAKKEYKKHDAASYVVGAAGALIVGWFLYKKVVPWWFAIVFLNKDIIIGKSKCKGDEKTLAGNVSLKQVQVKYQFDDVGGGSASCGYHILKNFMLLANALTKDSSNVYKELKDVQLVKNLFDDYEENMGRWRQFIVNRRGSGPAGGEWLHSNEIIALFNNERGNNSLRTDGVQYNFDTIEDTQVIETDFDDVTPQVRRNLAGAHGRTYIHGFGVNTAKHLAHKPGKKHGGAAGHWFLVLLHQKANGEREYIIADSGNSVRLKNKHVKKLINAIEGKDIWKKN